MANKRISLGDILKPATKDKQGKEIPADKRSSRYIKVNLPKNKDGSLKFPDGLTIMDGDILSLETTDEQKRNLTRAVTSGTMTEDLGDKIMERLNKRPDFVFGEAVLVIKEE